MFSIEKLPQLAKEYASKHSPRTGYTEKVAQNVYDAYKSRAFPPGTNIGVQLALQFDGKEASGDLVPNTEKQLPYGASFSLDYKSDCMDFVRNIILLLFGRNVGDWTEGAYQKNKNKQVPWEDRRPMDLLLFKLSSRNPHATHAALYIGDGKMLHTRSKSKPLMVTADTIYSAKSRTGTGVFRVLTDEEYKSLIVKGSEEEMLKKGDTGELVYKLQNELIARKHNIGKYPDLHKKDASGKPLPTGADGEFGDVTERELKAEQIKLGIEPTGTLDMAGAMAFWGRVDDAKVAELQKQVDSRGEFISAVKAAGDSLKTALDKQYI